ncbi:MAG: protoglobin domain-containing protein [Kofleriaceae bacterium]
MSELLRELTAYIGLTDEVQARLRALRPVLAPRFAAIAEEFYAAIDASPGARALIADAAQRERLKQTLVAWMDSGLAGPFDDAFGERRARIGRRHVQLQMAQHYMFAAMNVVRAAYHDHVDQLVPGPQRGATHRAVDQLLDLELALMLRTYQLDSEERLLTRERAGQAERIVAMQTLTAGLAHEVRNPLNAAKLQLELLERRLRRGGDDPKLIEPTTHAHHEIERLTALLNEFLSFARPPQLGAGDHDLRGVLHQVLEAERPLAQASGVALTMVDGGEPVMVEIDAGKIHQVAQNLVRNAIEAAMGRPAGAVTVALQPADDRGSVTLAVADNGPGIPEPVLERIYEPFYSTKEGGTGMGMAIVHSLVALHGGRLDVLTGPHGTRFTVVLRRRLR